MQNITISYDKNKHDIFAIKQYSNVFFVILLQFIGNWKSNENFNYFVIGTKINYTSTNIKLLIFKRNI